MLPAHTSAPSHSHCCACKPTLLRAKWPTSQGAGRLTEAASLPENPPRRLSHSLRERKKEHTRKKVKLSDVSKTCRTPVRFTARLTSSPHSCTPHHQWELCASALEHEHRAAPMWKAPFFRYSPEPKYATSTYCKGIQNMTKKIVQMLSICRKQMLSSLASLWQTSNSIQKIQHSQSGLTTMLPDMSLCFSCTFHVFPHAVLLPIIYDWSAPSLPFSISFNLCNSDLQWLIINTKMYMCVNKFGRI